MRVRKSDLQGASEQYMCRVRSSRQAKGWAFQEEESVLEKDNSSSWVLRRRKSDCAVLSWARRRHSSRTKRLKERRARTSACQSWRATPLA